MGYEIKRIKDIKVEEARSICKKHKIDCLSCPFVRTRTKDDKKIPLLCYWILKDIIKDEEDIVMKAEKEREVKIWKD